MQICFVVTVCPLGFLVGHRFAWCMLRLALMARARRDGEGRNRTGDTTIFSRVLYQLSYLAARRGW